MGKCKETMICDLDVRGKGGERVQGHLENSGLGVNAIHSVWRRRLKMTLLCLDSELDPEDENLVKVKIRVGVILRGYN